MAGKEGRAAPVTAEAEVEVMRLQTKEPQTLNASGIRSPDDQERSQDGRSHTCGSLTPSTTQAHLSRVLPHQCVASEQRSPFIKSLTLFWVHCFQSVQEV